MKKTIFILTFALSVSGFSKVTVNKSIRVDAGDRQAGGCTTVNGSIVIEEEAHVGGRCKTVNGSIKLKSGCVVDGLATVNGSIRVDEDCELRDDVESVNGSIRCVEGVIVDGSVRSVNGAIHLKGVTVKKDITNHNGDITLEKESVVYDDIIIKDTKGNNRRDKPLEIVIDNSVVRGDIVNRNDEVEVVVYLLNGGDVRGRIENASVERD